MPSLPDGVERTALPLVDAPLTGWSVSVLTIRTLAIEPLPVGAVGNGDTGPAELLASRPLHPRAQITNAAAADRRG